MENGRVRVLKVYDSKTGYTEEMAKAIEKGLTSENAQAVRKRVEGTNVDELSAFVVVVIGSPTYFGT